MSVSDGILKEADILWRAIATGILLVFVYDLLRLARKIIRHGAGWVSLEDFFFWAASAVVIFAMLYRENDGVLRAYSIGGVALGMVFYSLLSARVFRKQIRKMIYFFKKRLKKLREAVKISLCKR